MGNVIRRWAVFGGVVTIVAAVMALQWSRLAADDTAPSQAADGTAGLAAEGTSAQAVKSNSASDKSVAEKPGASPTITSYLLTANEDDERIRQGLAKTAELEFDDLPLREAVAYISKQHSIRVLLDERALTDLNITSDTPVTRNVSNVSLKSALRLLLRPLQLTFRVDSGVLQITSQTEYDNQLEIRVYPVGDLITPFDKPDSREEVDFDSLEDVITQTIAPTSWDSVGGPGSMGPHGQSLIVSQTEEVHEQMEGLIRTLRKVRSEQQKKLGGPGIDILSDERTRSIERAVKEPVDWEFDEIPLRDAANFIAKQSRIQVQFDERALTDLNITSDTPVTRTLSGVSLKSALPLLLRPLQLAYVVENEVLLITSQTEADNKQHVRIYPAGDLLDSQSDERGVKGSSRDFDSLIDVITTTVAPTSWDSVGGPSSIGIYEGALALVISQTQEVHEQLDALLARMRQAQPRRGEKSAATGSAEDGALVTRVYALWQIGPQRERHGDEAQFGPTAISRSSRRRANADSERLAQFGGGLGGFGQLGGGGAILSERDFVAVPPQGVPSEQAASLIRRFVEPESWKQPGAVLQAAQQRLVIRQTAPIHKKTQEFLEKLGPWREVKKGAGGMGGPPGIAGGFGGAFQVADPFAPPAQPRADGNPFGAPAKSDGGDPFAQPAKAPADRDPFDAPAAAKSRTRAAVTPEAKAAAHTASAPYLPSAAETRVREELAKPTEMEFNDLPLRDGIQYLKDRHGIEIQIDEKELTENGVKRDAPITIAVKGISLRSALRLLLSQLSASATFVVADEVLLITTREGARQRTSVRIYDVSDFAEPRVAAGSDPFGPQAPAPPPYATGPQSGVHGLVNVIERAIAPGTWGADHGSGVVPLVRNDSALLVVHHSAGVHDEIVDLLASLREVQRRARRAER